MVRLTDYGIQDNARELLHVETRNLCRCEECFGKHSHQKAKLPVSRGNLHPGVTVTGIGKISEHYLSLTWSDGHQGMIARTVRGEYGPEPVPSLIEKYLELSMRHNKLQRFWGSADQDNYKIFDFNTVIGSLDNTREFFAHYMTHGIAFLSGVPQGRSLVDVIEGDLKCGPITETMFGKYDVVRYKESPLNVGYGSGGLAGHTDLNYFYQNPHVQFFQSLENTVEGGESFWIDSFAAITELQAEKPEYFDVLCKVPIFQRFTPPGTDKYVRSHHPLINMMGDDIMRINDNPWSEDHFLASQTLSLNTRTRWWEAYLYYRAKMEDQSRWIKRKLGGGEIVMTDNWRVYHGRESFVKTEKGQERIVATAYLSWNHVQKVMISPVEAEIKSCFLEIDNH